MPPKLKGFLPITISLAIGLVTGILLGLSLIQAPPQQNVAPISSEKQQTEQQEKSKFNLMIDFEDGKVTTLNDIEISENASLLDTMKNGLAAANIPFEYKEYSGLGALVTKIGDKSNGTGTSYWQYWVNNKMPPVGASSYQPRAGDIIEWKFLPDQGF